MMPALGFIFKMKRLANEKKYSVDDEVILHQFPRGEFAPSLSPFPIKLETW